MQALASCNDGYAAAYGDDQYTRRAQEICVDMFGSTAQLFHVYGGTPANILAMEPLLDRYGAILCSTDAHITMDETGAPERILGNKIYSLRSELGCITPGTIDEIMPIFADEHKPFPQVLSLSQATEYENVYSLSELAVLGEKAREHGLKIHIDGARISNAAVALNCSIADITNACGASSLSLGMTKNGGMFGENVVFFNKELARNFIYRRKNAMQLHSKMRYISAQFVAFFENDLWQRCASHANDMARLLESKIGDVKNITITSPAVTNAVFATIPREITTELQEVAKFHVWNQKTNEVRWMCSWSTTEADVHQFADAIARLAG